MRISARHGAGAGAACAKLDPGGVPPFPTPGSKFPFSSLGCRCVTCRRDGLVS